VARQDGRAYCANGRNRTISIVAANDAGHLGAIEIIASTRGARTIAADLVLHTQFSLTADL